MTSTPPTRCSRRAESSLHLAATLCGRGSPRVGWASSTGYGAASTRPAVISRRRCASSRGREESPVSFVVDHLGVPAREDAALAEAAPHHHRALTIARAVGNPQDEAWNVAGIGIVHLYAGEPERAIELLEDGYQVEEDLGLDFESATVLVLLTVARALVGDPDEAVNLLARAHDKARRLGSARPLDALRRARSTVAVARGDLDRAARLSGPAARLRDDHAPTHSMFRTLFDDDARRLRSPLGDVAFEAAWSTGRRSRLAATTA